MSEQVVLLTFACLGSVLILVPLAFHIQNRNVAVICLCLWLSLYNGITFINGLLWNGPITKSSPVAPGYCDIATRVQLTSTPALLGCAIAILRFLSSILSSKGLATNMRSSKLRQNSIDTALIFAVPITIIIMQLIVYRNARYIITPFHGCTLSLFTPNTTYMLFVYIWSPLLGIGAIYYAISIVWALNRKRNDFRQVLRNSNAGLDLSRFLRLLMLAMLTIFVVAPVIFYQFYGQVQYLSLDAAIPQGHYTDIIFLYGAPEKSQLTARWLAAIISIIFAGLFGIGREARNHYVKWFKHVPGSERLLSYGSHMSHMSRGLSGRFSRQTHHKQSHNANSCDDASTLYGDGSRCEMSNIKITTKTLIMTSS